MSASHARIKRTVRVVLILMVAYCTTMGCTALMLDSSKFLSRVDHLVYGTPDLEASIRHLEEVLGVKAGHGGQHPGQGTRNAVLALGPTSYLEIIGLDPEQPEPDRPRWLGIDDLDAPRLVTWAAKGQALGSVVNQAVQANVHLGSVLSGRRDRPDGSALHWKLTDPHQVVDDGIVPFFIDWGGSPHPATTAPRGLTLVGLRAEHPRAKHVCQDLEHLDLALPVVVGTQPALIAMIRTRKGLVELR